jgi:hypothetical protein
MKINDILTQEIALRSRAESAEKKTQLESFKNLLEGELDLSLQAFKEHGRSPVFDNPAETMPIQLFLGADASDNDSAQAVTALDNAGEGLDKILQGLQAHNLPLASVEEAISSLSREAEQLQAIVKGLPQNDALKELGEEMKVLAYVESIKWKRGDYI